MWNILFSNDLLTEWLTHNCVENLEAYSDYEKKEIKNTIVIYSSSYEKSKNLIYFIDSSIDRNMMVKSLIERHNK